MRWRKTGNAGIEDRRGAGFGGFGMPAAGGGLGVVGIIVFVLMNMLGGSGGGVPSFTGPAQSAQQDELADFMGFLSDHVQGVWQEEFRQMGRRYEDTVVVLFEQATQTGCGVGSAQTGPFYCPGDRKVYLDLSFFRELSDRFGAPGDFAQAYVIAHEFGHHVQTVLGLRPDGTNEGSVRHELQADCFAGVWAAAARDEGLLESGDVQEGLEAAAAVGDDRIQQQTGQRVDPESWTHGSSEQRTTWFDRGFDRGDPEACDTSRAA